MKTTDLSQVYSRLEKTVTSFQSPVVDLIEAQTKDPFKILVATILSARTQDGTTAKACKKLFAEVHTPHDLKKIALQKLEELIFPVGFYKTKAKHLKELPFVLEEKFGGKLPETVEELVELPGVGRKTANLVVAVGFHKPAICVDIHVHRIMNRLGFLRTVTPLETEMTLRKKLPVEYWMKTNFLFVAFGQNTCRPISPHCSACPIRPFCERKGVTSAR